MADDTPDGDAMPQPDKDAMIQDMLSARQIERDEPSVEVTRQAIIDTLVKHHVIGAREAVDRLIAAVRAEPPLTDDEQTTQLPQCPSCACIGEATIQWREEQIPVLSNRNNLRETVDVTARVPVWTCNACEFSWTDSMAEGIRDEATKDAREAFKAQTGAPSRICPKDGKSHCWDVCSPKYCASEKARELTGAPSRQESQECGATCEQNDDLCNRPCILPEDHDGRHECKNHAPSRQEETTDDER